MERSQYNENIIEFEVQLPIFALSPNSDPPWSRHSHLAGRDDLQISEVVSVKRRKKLGGWWREKGMLHKRRIEFGLPERADDCPSPMVWLRPVRH